MSPPGQMGFRFDRAGVRIPTLAVSAIALDTHRTGHVPDIHPGTATGHQANDYMNDRTTRIYPGLIPHRF